MFSGFKNRFGLSEIITRIFPVLNAGEEGAPGGDSGAATAVADKSQEPVAEVPGFDKDIPVPKEFLESSIENDPEYQALLKEEEELKKKEKKATKTKDTPDESEPEDKNTGKEPEGESDKSGKEDESEPEDENAGADEDFDFADDVIKGLKGEHLKTLPKEAKLAIAEYYENSNQTAADKKALEERLAVLSNDPVVKLREEMLKKGLTEFDVRGITKQEKDALISKIQNIGLSPDESEQIFSFMEETIKAVASERAQDVLNNRVIEDDLRKKTDETITNGRNIFLQLGQFHKDLAFKETDGNKFWVKDKSGEWLPNEKHPEIKAYSEKILPIIESLGKPGPNGEPPMKYIDLINLSKRKGGLKAIYTMVAEIHGLPVAINTGERDKKILKSELQKKMAPFLRGSGGEELAAGKGKSKTEESQIMKHGYDITKLASDNTYYDSVVDSKPGDLEHAKLVAKLAEEGEEYLRKKSKK
jgi:hypothetical protein